MSLKSDDLCKQKNCKRLCIKKKTVSFSNEVRLRRTTIDDDGLQQTYYPWFTHEEIVSMKKRAKNLAALHHLKTRPGQKAPSPQSGIVYNCHPAHYEIIGESLRGMEHITDETHGRNRLRSGVISLIREHQDQENPLRGYELACKYVEYSEEAMAYAIQIAEEDARIAAAIFTEDLKQDDDDESSMSSPCGITDLPEIPRLSSSSAAA